MAKYIIRFDDFYVGMEKKNFLHATKVIRENSIPAIIGVVPAWQDELEVRQPVNEKEFWQTIRSLQENGCEIALHGYSHKLFKHENLLGVNQYGEFSGLPLEEQKIKINNGLRVFSKNGIHCRMFMAPAHSFDMNTLTALKFAGISLITDGKSFYPYLWNELIFIPQISSKFTVYPWGIITICLHPQWMNDSSYTDLVLFCRKQTSNIISVQCGVYSINKMSAIKRTVDALVRQLYFLIKKIK